MPSGYCVIYWGGALVYGKESKHCVVFLIPGESARGLIIYVIASSNDNLSSHEIYKRLCQF